MVRYGPWLQGCFHYYKLNSIRLWHLSQNQVFK
jgi:hypothetical protein